MNLDSGAIAWRIPFGEHPELVAQGMAPTGTENYGGPIVTAGGLLFIGATNHDKKFRAFDKADGELLWETTLPASGNATPAMYEADGRQFIAIAAGGGQERRGVGRKVRGVRAALTAGRIPLTAPRGRLKDARRQQRRDEQKHRADQRLNRRRGYLVEILLGGDDAANGAGDPTGPPSGHCSSPIAICACSETGRPV